MPKIVSLLDCIGIVVDQLFVTSTVKNPEFDAVFAIVLIITDFKHFDTGEAL
jgi:hypothetical protein